MWGCATTTLNGVTMTDNAFKKAARQRQKATGESYSRARRHVDKNNTDDGHQSTAALLSALGISDTNYIEFEALWAPRQHQLPGDSAADTSLLLRVPVGLRDDGTVLWLDLKDESDGGNGPHHLVIGMTGSGKTTLLRALVFGLLTLHSNHVVQVILGAFKAADGWAAFADYPHTTAILEDGQAMADHLLDLIDQRGRILHDAGVELRGKGFDTFAQYHTARWTQAGKTLPPLPAVFVVIDDLDLMINDHPTAAAAYGLLVRKGRSLGVYSLPATQTINMEPDIVDCVSQRIALRRVSSPAHVADLGPGLDDAANIPEDRDSSGVGFVATAPGADPIRFRGFRVPDSLIRNVGRQLRTDIVPRRFR